MSVHRLNTRLFLNCLDGVSDENARERPNALTNNLAFLDGYVDHMAFAPGPTLFRHFIEEAQAQAGSVYGRTRVAGDLERAIRELKAEREGEVEVAGPNLARSLTEPGLINEYRIYLHPIVLGHGKPYFAGPRPPLHLRANDRIDGDVIRLAYVPA